jgi:nitrogen PTS system EIIA component
MKIKDFLCLDAVSVDLKSEKKEEVISELVDLMVAADAVEKKNKKRIVEVLLAREALGSTAVGQGIAIPHGKCDCVKNLVGCFGISKRGVNFDSLDGEPAYIFFLLVAPIDSAGPHLKALAKISRLLKDKYLRDSLRNAKDVKTIIDIVQQEDERLANA